VTEPRSTQNSLSSQQEEVFSAGSARSALHVVVPGDLETRTGGYGYDRRIIAGLRALGWTVNIVALEGSFPAPTPEARAHAVAALAAIPDGALVLADGLALGALPEEIERERERLTVIALVHHPLAAETGLDRATAAALEVSERRALAAARAVVVTSRTTAATLGHYGVTADRITVIEPGTDQAPLARRPVASAQSPAPIAQLQAPSSQHPAPSSQHPGPSSQHPVISLLCVATLTPRKGYAILIEALAAIPHRNWRLRCAGSLDRDTATTARVRALIREHDLDDCITLLGDLDAGALAAEYDRADLFVLPTLYEGYGMAVAEALARGVPVISTATGAIDCLVTGGFGTPAEFPAGLVVPPGDATAFTVALERVLGDADLRAQLAHGARIARTRLPRWSDACDRLADLLDRTAQATRE
jgi:glycosyltransferase involved in cell wall biosynthesis